MQSIDWVSIVTGWHSCPKATAHLGISQRSPSTTESLPWKTRRSDVFPSLFQACPCVAECRQRRAGGGIVVLQNKAPRWNEALNAYCLNFKGRVTQASVKNFQLASAADADTVLLQFGKVRMHMLIIINTRLSKPQLA